MPGSVGATPVGGSDPFTGAGRYVPGGGQTGLPNTQPSSDPFTGNTFIDYLETIFFLAFFNFSDGTKLKI